MSNNFSFGFYEELKNLKKDDIDVDFEFLRNLYVTSETSAFGFLHGCCEEFAAMLSDAFGYEIECVRNANHRLIHAYCVSYIGDEKAYIDVRGITTDKELFFEEFENELTYYVPDDAFLVVDDEGYELEAEVETWVNKDELFDGELEGWDDPDIMRFIKDYTDYYDVEKYVSIFRCKECSAELEASDEDHDWFNSCGEEELWGHLQTEHPELYKECCGLETPDMLSLCYEHVVEKVVAPVKCLDEIIRDVRNNKTKDSETGRAGGVVDIVKNDFER